MQSKILAILLTIALSASETIAPVPISFPHELIDTSPFIKTEENENVSLDLNDRPREGTGISVPDGHFLSGDWEYAYVIAGDQAGTIYLWDYRGNNPDLTLPQKLDGIQVTGVHSAFKNNNTVRSVIIPEGYTFIGDSTFLHCAGLEKVSVPNSVQSIGASAFLGCTALKEINLPEGITELDSFTFSECASLTEIALPQSLTKIEDDAFKGCASLREINIPDGMTELGHSVFTKCTSLHCATLGKGIAEIPQGVFSGCTSLEKIEVKGTISAIGNTALSGTGLQSFTVPETVTSIGTYAFQNCPQLFDIALPASLIDLAGNAFAGCSSLKELKVYGDGNVLCAREGVLYKNNGKALACYPAGRTGAWSAPEGVEEILPYAFCRCENLMAVTLPDTVTTVGSRAFYDCSSLFSVSFGNGLEELGELIFDECPSLTILSIAPGNSNYLCENCGLIDLRTGCYYYAAGPQPAKLVIPDGIVTIGDGAFSNHSEIVSLSFPNTLTTIGNSAFYGCDSLQTVTFGGKEEIIGQRAFQYCTSLSSVKLPDSAVDLGTSAFFGCTSLSDVRLSPATTDLPSALFGNCTSLREIAIPDSVTNISNSFYGSGLATAVIPDDVTKIGDAFRDCTSLSRLVIGNGVTKLSYTCLSGCSSLHKLYFPAGLEFRLNLIQDCAALTDIYYGGSRLQWEMSLRPSSKVPEIPSGITISFSAKPADCLQ